MGAVRSRESPSAFIRMLYTFDVFALVAGANSPKSLWRSWIIRPFVMFLPAASRLAFSAHSTANDNRIAPPTWFPPRTSPVVLSQDALWASVQKARRASALSSQDITSDVICSLRPQLVSNSASWNLRHQTSSVSPTGLGICLPATELLTSPLSLRNLAVVWIACSALVRAATGTITVSR